MQSVLGGIGADMAQAVLFGTIIPLIHVDGVDRSAIESTICAALVSRFEMMECCIDGDPQDQNKIMEWVHKV